jgi:hypothetical protein
VQIRVTLEVAASVHGRRAQLTEVSSYYLVWQAVAFSCHGTPYFCQKRPWYNRLIFPVQIWWVGRPAQASPAK